jgi:hypothetical protein
MIDVINTVGVHHMAVLDDAFTFDAMDTPIVVDTPVVHAEDLAFAADAESSAGFEVSSPSTLFSTSPASLVNPPSLASSAQLLVTFIFAGTAFVCAGLGKKRQGALVQTSRGGVLPNLLAHGQAPQVARSTRSVSKTTDMMELGFAKFGPC